MVHTSFQSARGYTEIVPRRDRRTLAVVLNRKLSANSVIHSDESEWRCYFDLPQSVPVCIQHNFVNHTYNFVDPATGAHTSISNKFLLYIIVLLLASWQITVIDVDWYHRAGGLSFGQYWNYFVNSYFMKKIILLKCCLLCRS